LTDKAQLIDLWRAVLLGRLEILSSSQQAARSGTRVDGEHRPANRGERAAVTSQGYLAHAFGARTQVLQDHLDNLEDMGDGPRSEVVVGAVITVSLDDGPAQHIAIFPGGDATKLTVDGQPVTVLSAQSPMATQLRDTEAGEAVEVELGGELLCVDLIAIA
jgi:transcription elongation GreA/GreB family factor